MKLINSSFAVLGVFVILALVTAACGGNEPTATPPPTATVAPTATVPPPTATRVLPSPTATIAKPKRGGVLRTDMTRNEDGKLDLHWVRTSPTWVLATPMLSWVVELDQKQGQIRPDLAEKWNVSQDGLTYTFNLVREARWSDGKPVTADDILYSLDRISGKLDLATPAYKSTLSAVAGYRKVDDYTVEVTLKNVSATFLANLGILGNMIYPKHVPMTEFAAKRPVGSGPFVLASYQSDIGAELKRNQNYWKKDRFGDALPYLDGIQVFIIPDTTARIAAFTTGQLDYSMAYLSPFQGRVKDVEAKVPGVQWIHEFSQLAVFIRAVPPYADQRLRTAMHLALDRRAASQIRYPGESKDLIAISPPGGSWAFSDSELSQFPGYRQPKDQDITEAKRLLTAALQDAGLSLDTWKPIMTYQDIWQDFAAIAANQLKQNLGLNVTLKSLDRATDIQIEAQGNFELEVAGFGAALDDPSQTMEPFARTGGGLNFGRVSDPAIDGALDEIGRTLDPVKRKQLSQALERKLLDAAWWLVIVGDAKHQAIRPEVRNYYALFSQDNRANRHEITWLDR